MQTIITDLLYSRAQRLMLFTWARAQNVRRGGRYDVREDDRGEAIISVWAAPWITNEDRARSTRVGTFTMDKADENRIGKIEVDEGHTEADLLHELALLEAEALGRTIHGKRKKS